MNWVNTCIFVQPVFSIRPFGLVGLKHWGNQASEEMLCPLKGQWISAASSVLKDWRLKRYCNNQYNQQTVLFHLPGAMFKHLLAHAESLPHVDSRTQYFTIFKKSVTFIHLVTFLNMLEPSTQQLVTAVGATGNQLPKPRLDFYQRNFSQLLL